MSKLNIEELKKVKTKYIGKGINYFSKIDSTQTEAKRNIEKYKNGEILIADYQTAGVGTHGRTWLSGNEENIILTICLKPNLTIDDLSGFTVKIAEIIKQIIKDLYGIDLTVKKPNDLLLNNKKICGILVETSLINNNVKSMVIGIGFDVYQIKFDKEIENIATSLVKEFPKIKFSREKIMVRIMEEIENEIDKRNR